MRLTRLELRAFGHFSDRTIDLSGGQHGLHIIHGPNEAGKSTALEAIHRLFYGFPTRATYDFTHAGPDLRVGAELCNSTGENLTVVRRKGRKDTLLGADGQTLPDAVLDPFLHGLDEELFRTLFGIGYASLVSGGLEILNAEGDVGKTLFAAGAGVGSVKRVLDSLRSEAEALYAPKAQKPPINGLLRACREEKATVRDTSVLPDTWHDLENELADLESQRAKHHNRLSEIAAERKVLERRRRAIPVISEHNDLNEDIAKLSNDPATILNHSDSIEQLHEDLGHYRKACEDRPKRVSERDELESKALHELRSIYPDKSLEDVDSLRTSDTQRRDIRTLARGHAQVQQAADNSLEQMRDIETHIDATRREAEALPPVRDTAPLRRTVADVQRRGDLDAQRGDRVEERYTAQAEAKSELAKLRGWSGTLEELATWSPPASQAIDDFEDKLSDAVDDVQRRGERLTETKRVAARSWPAYVIAGSLTLAVLVGSMYAWYNPAPLIGAIVFIVMGGGMLVIRRKWLDDAREASTAHGEADRCSASIGEDWRAAWSGAVDDPASPREMRDWLTQRERILPIAARLREIETNIQQIDEYVENSRSQLELLLGELDEDVHSAQSFGAVLIHCEEVVAQIEEDAQVRRNTERRLDEQVSQRDAREATCEKASEALGEWRTAWTRAVAPLRLDPEPSPVDAEMAVEKHESMFAHLEDADELDRRIAQIDKTLTDFDDRVRTHADLVQLPNDEPAEQIAGQLYRDLNTLKTLTNDRDNCETRIRDIAEGSDVTELIESCRGVLPDTLDTELSVLSYEESELEPKLAAAIENITEKRQTQRGFDGSSEAAEAEQNVQAVLSSLRGHVERYAELRMAEYLLQRAIEQYRKENEGPVLAHATKAFAALTCGSFASLRSDYDEKEHPTLRGVRPGGESLDVESMSEGTVDQLYLALRIGALEHYLSANEPMPFIADDVLVKFDDRRTAAAMRLFADLSDRTQVLYFTHHDSVVDVAEAIEAERPGRVFIQRLSPAPG